MVWMEFENAKNSVSSRDLACYIITEMFNQHCAVTETKVQKLAYMIYWFYLGETKKIIVDDEKPKARPYWPVFPIIHNFFKMKNISEIDAKKYDKETIQDKNFKDILKDIIGLYWKRTAWQLVKRSHNEDSPRSFTTKQKDFIWNNPIDDELTYNYFKW